MVSNVDTAKRALVTLLKSLAAIYGVVVGITRESTDKELVAVFRKVCRKVHPDRGGAEAHQKALNAARDLWDEAMRASKGRGGNRKAAPLTKVHTEKQETVGFRFQGVGVLLTYQKFADAGCWQSFVDFIEARRLAWKVQYWGGYHGNES